VTKIIGLVQVKGGAGLSSSMLVRGLCKCRLVQINEKPLMRSSRSLVLLLLACCLSQPALGVAQPALGVTIFGRPDCGLWLSKKRETDKAWLLGYVSALSVSEQGRISGASDPFGKISSAEQIFIWMNNYCQKNPLSNVGAGAFSLYSELLLSNPK
jgi:hypothetical protein